MVETRHFPVRLIVVCLCLAAILVGVSFVNPAFRTPGNLVDLLTHAAPTIIVACGMTLVMVTGEIDISVGSLTGFLAAFLGILVAPSRLDVSTPAALAMIVAAGAAFGLINGALVTFARVPSIVATLGMLTVLRGLTELSLRGEWITDLPPSVRALGTGTWAGLPWSVWAAFLVTLGTAMVLRRSVFGVQLRAVGGNQHAAAISRVAPARIKLLAFAALGGLTALSVLVSVPQLSVIESGIGVGFELTVITAVVVGGTSITGGFGTIAGAVIVAILLVCVRSMLIFLKLGDAAVYWERALQGGFILAAVLADRAARVAPRVGVAA